MISWVAGFDGRVMGVVYDDTHRGCSDPGRGFGGESFSSKLRNSRYKWEDWSIVHFSVR